MQSGCLHFWPPHLPICPFLFTHSTPTILACLFDPYTGQKFSDLKAWPVTISSDPILSPSVIAHFLQVWAPLTNSQGHFSDPAISNPNPTSTLTICFSPHPSLSSNDQGYIDLFDCLPSIRTHVSGKQAFCPLLNPQHQNQCLPYQRHSYLLIQ